eukprot:13833131-Alexandrium_andersonii.AAC.1
MAGVPGPSAQTVRRGPPRSPLRGVRRAHKANLRSDCAELLYRPLARRHRPAVQATGVLHCVHRSTPGRHTQGACKADPSQ